MEQLVQFLAKFSVLSVLAFNFLCPLFMLHILFTGWSRVRRLLEKSNKLSYAFHTAAIAFLLFSSIACLNEKVITAISPNVFIYGTGLIAFIGAIASFIGIKTLRKLIRTLPQ